jgi:hypothetical protein
MVETTSYLFIDFELIQGLVAYVHIVQSSIL